MKRIGLKILLVVLAIVFSLMALPTFMVQTKTVAEGVNEKVKYSLLPATYNDNSELVLDKYNIQPINRLPYQPFDQEKQKKMDGMSFKFNETTYGRIENQFVKLDNCENISITDNLALSVWIYFDSVYVHDLTLTLELENGADLVWNIEADALYGLVTKSEFDLVTPHGWNKIYFPLAKATKSGEVLENGCLVSPTQLIVNYYSLLENDNIASLYFYDIALENASENQNYQVEKQRYNIFSAYFYDIARYTSFCEGDSITLPSYEKAITYAFQGNRDLKKEATKENSILKWRVYVISPSGESKEVSFSSKVTFNEIGTYKILYRCFEVENQSTKVILSPYKEITISKLNPIYFDRSEFKIKVGVNNLINIYTSPLFDNVSDISFEYDTSALEVSLDENKKVKILAKKTGKYQIKAKVTGSRTTSQPAEYETVLSVKSVKATTDKNHTIKIVVWTASACFVVAILISIVILVVKSRKIVVK